MNGYDSSGNLIKRTDARGITTTYSYDQLNRLTAKTYSDGTPDASYVYDQSSVWGVTVENPVGRRVLASAAQGARGRVYSYDPMGRPKLILWTVSQGPSKRVDYTYNFDGSVSSLSYPSNRVVNYTYDGAGRVLSIRDPSQSVDFLGSATYTPAGSLAGAKLGANITLSNTYNTRLQPDTMSASAPSGPLMLHTYDLHLASGDNGNVYGIGDLLDQSNIPGRPIGSLTFTYDQLNRLSSAQSSGTDCTDVGGVTKNWGNTYTIDAWGNLTNKLVSKCTAELLNEAVGSDNRFAGAGRYDASGNMTENGQFVYDGENRLVKLAGDSASRYLYDADGARVAKADVLYWLGADGSVLAESDASGNLTSEYIFFGGKRIARVDIKAP